MKGTVKFYNRAKDFGFISGENGNEYYFNSASLLSPVENDMVTFTPQETAKGTVAKKVKIAQDAACKPSKLKHGLMVVVTLLIGVVIGHFLPF